MFNVNRDCMHMHRCVHAHVHTHTISKSKLFTIFVALKFVRNYS